MRIPVGALQPWVALFFLGAAACGPRSLGIPDSGPDAGAEADTLPEATATADAATAEGADPEAAPPLPAPDAGPEAPPQVVRRRVSGSVALSTIDPTIPAHVMAAP